MKKTIILVLSMGVFFSIPFSLSARDLENRGSSAGNIADAETGIDPEVIDPMARIGGIAKDGLVVSMKEGDETVSRGVAAETVPVSEAEAEYSELLAGYPMADMAKALSEEESETAAFLIAIAKKESDWGLHAPQKDGRDCFNYWGYRGSYNETDSGYSCFDLPEQAVSVVGERISELIGKDIDTPAKMIVWKCGSACKEDDPASVAKWISDVSAYYRRVDS
ncbi:MAG: hypothetical protein HGB08_03515 [Candidatus Moranbacteria bacterium]|nr:hypothetical protein [Candidatus Moranbacteria bacterium]